MQPALSNLDHKTNNTLNTNDKMTDSENGRTLFSLIWWHFVSQFVIYALHNKHIITKYSTVLNYSVLTAGDHLQRHHSAQLQQPKQSSVKILYISICLK